MISRGARNLVFLSRSGNKKAEAQATLTMCEEQGCRVLAPACDVADESAVAAALEQVKSWPKIKGVIQGAMVLQDAIYENMTHSQYMAAVRPKVQGSWNLHKLLPDDLDFFVMLSSSAGIAGSRGQGNYAAGMSGILLICMTNTNFSRKFIPGCSRKLPNSPWQAWCSY